MSECVFIGCEQCKIIKPCNTVVEWVKFRNDHWYHDVYKGNKLFVEQGVGKTWEREVEE